MRTLMLAMLLLVPFAYADGTLLAQSPGNATTIESGIDTFIFGATEDAMTDQVSTCTLLIDGEQYKTLTINGALGGGTRRFTQTLDPGEYAWRVECEHAGGAYATVEQAVSVTSAAASEVEVTASGAFRGSFLHSFTIDDHPVTVPGVAPGDYIEITIDSDPSTFTREFYLQSKLAQDGENFVKFTASGQIINVYEQRNTTLQVGRERVVMNLLGFEGSKATFIVYPYGTAEEPEEEPEVTEPEEPEVVEPPEPEVVEPETSPPRSPPAQERQGFFSWMLSLFAGIFGA